MVGAVIVKDGRIIGQGYHEVYGGPHAERNALASCSESPEGASIYVTLEPCCHHGKTPPCTDALIEHGISRVIIGSSDPNPLVSGKGVSILKSHGIQVTEGVLKEECDSINSVFFHYIKTKRPYVMMKYAMTMDGKIATSNGSSRWITGEEARKKVHEDRGIFRSIMVGIGTVLADDPLLTCRIPGKEEPLRVICDSSLRMPLDSNISKTALRYPTLLATCCQEEKRLLAYRRLGYEVLSLPGADGRVDLNALMEELGSCGVDSLLLEGGGELNWAVLNAGLVNRVQTYIAPKLFGGAAAKSPIAGSGVDFPDGAFSLVTRAITKIGNDILIESDVTERKAMPCSQES
jgi:diaminohydroxyphosphoribosylaminopyrimidine deaminase/5-amino-6-(5-phosphoribosylamino)uracil reductase